MSCCQFKRPFHINRHFVRYEILTDSLLQCLPCINRNTSVSNIRGNYIEKFVTPQ
jgi:hypothetical protein